MPVDHIPLLDSRLFSDLVCSLVPPLDIFGYLFFFPASLRFQPTKRPQLQKGKSKTGPSKAPVAPPSAANNSTPSIAAPTSVAARAVPKTTLADWTADDDDDVNGFYAGEKRQRGGRKKRKKNREAETYVQNWDDIYDPSRPNNYEEYRHSDEKIQEVREWKDRLYAHRMARGTSSVTDSDEENAPSQLNSKSSSLRLIMLTLTCSSQDNLLPRQVLRLPLT